MKYDLALKLYFIKKKNMYDIIIKLSYFIIFLDTNTLKGGE